MCAVPHPVQWREGGRQGPAPTRTPRLRLSGGEGVTNVPHQLDLYVCPDCGRVELSMMPLRPGHRWHGRWCNGSAIVVTYELTGPPAKAKAPSEPAVF
jgi:hypothetical protein